MSSEWREYCIDEIKAGEASSIAIGPFGSRMKSDCYVESGVRVVRGTNLTSGRVFSGDFVFVTSDKAAELGGANLAPFDLVFPHRGAIGEVGIVPDDGEHYVLSTSLMKLKCHQEKADPLFVYYFFKSDVGRFELLKNASQVGTPGIGQPLTSLKGIRLKMPMIEEQRRIAGMLGVLDDRITLLRETNATLEAIAQALFKSWFVDFDPVRAKAEGRQPEGMDATTAALFPDSFEESELGLVPKGWSLVPFGELLVHTIGGDWGDESPSDKNEVRVAIIRGTDIPDLQLGAANRVPIRYTSSKKLSTRQLQDGDLVLEVSGGSKDQPTGRALYLTNQLLGQFDCPVEPASFCRLLRPASRDIGVLLGQQLTYIYSIGKTWEYQNQSTGIANFQTTHFLESELVAVPSPEVLAEFSTVVRAMIDRAHQSQIRELTQLRDTLLPRLISGQLRLPEAETLLEKAL
ncbi:restriction endonuclease subunit S [Pseudomonas sp. NY15367]